MRYIKCFALFTILFFMLSACGKGESNLKIEISSPDKNLNELASKTYSKSQLLNIVQFEGTMDELNEQYPIECMREIGNTYRVSYLGDDCVAVIVFDNSKNKICGNVYNLFLTKADFNDLAVGQSLDSVKRLDPHGEYLFLYTGRNDTPKISTHYTKDGYLITVEYDDENIILSVTIDLI